MIYFDPNVASPLAGPSGFYAPALTSAGGTVGDFAFRADTA